MKAIVALVLVLSLANANLTSRLNYSDKRSIMAVMLQVESMLKTNHPLDTINGVLQDFKNSITEEQVLHEEVYGKQKAECDSELAYRTTEIADSSANLKAANTQLKTCTIQKNKAEAFLGFNDQTLIQNRQHIDLINDVRRQETAIFNKASASFNAAINAIDDSLDLCGQISIDGSFVEISKMSGKLLSHAVLLQKTQIYQAVLASIASLSTEKADRASVDRLVDLLKNLRNDMAQSFSDYQSDNAQSLEVFSEQQHGIQENIKRLEVNEQRLHDKIENLAGCIAVNTAKAQAQSNRLQRNQLLFEDATVLCNSFDQEYTATTAGRKQELVLAAELERLVDRRFTQLSG